MPVTDIDNFAALEELNARLQDRWWRLNNLYYIKDEKGKKVLFKPNEVQKYLHDNLWFMNLVPKARQLGVTTFFAILYLDQVLFSENQTATIIAHTEKDMRKIFKNKIRFAWDNLYPWLKAKIGEPNNDSVNELVFGNGSSISVALSSRSDTVQFLHISEFGKICARFPEKAEEIVTGAINAVHAGQMVSIESTAEGSEGYFYDFCMKAEALRKENKTLTPLDFKIFFFPWWIDPRYTLDGDVTITQEMAQYFEILEKKHGITLSEGQKRWYIKKREMNGGKTFSEYPSTLEECFKKEIEGAYYATEMSRVYLQNRITAVPFDPTLPVDTFWDLGMNDMNVLLLTQSKGPQIRFIDMYYNHGEPLYHYVDWLQKRKDDFGYRYNNHYFPHDIEVRDLQSGVTRKESMYKLGLRNIRVGAKVPVQDGIDRVRSNFSRFWFDEAKCKKLADALAAYRREWDHKLGVWKDKPRHDDNSHFADAVRLLGQEWREQMPEWSDDVWTDSKSASQREQSFFG